MINPFRSEAEAYHFLLLTVGYFAAIAIAALTLGKWAGSPSSRSSHLPGSSTSCADGASSLRDRLSSRHSRENERPHPQIANETVGGGSLREEIHRRSEGQPTSRSCDLPGAQLSRQALGVRRGQCARQGAGSG